MFNKRKFFSVFVPIVLAVMLMTGCSPVVLIKPGSNEVAMAPAANPPPLATGPVYSIEFALRDYYKPSSLSASLNGIDLASSPLFSSCINSPSSPGTTCAYVTQADDFFPQTPSNWQTLTWTALCDGTAICNDVSYTALFQVYGLGFACVPDCRSPYGLELSATGGSGTVTVFLGVPAPDPAGLDIEVVPDASVFWLSINGAPVATPVTVHIPARDQRVLFTVGLNVPGLPPPWGLPPSGLLGTSITIKAKGFARSSIPVTIRP